MGSGPVNWYLDLKVGVQFKERLAEFQVFGGDRVKDLLRRELGHRQGLFARAGGARFEQIKVSLGCLTGTSYFFSLFERVSKFKRPGHASLSIVALGPLAATRSDSHHVIIPLSLARE